MPDTQFAIKTEVFEGPLELLLDLIEKRKLLINDISLAAVTDDYMAYVSSVAEGKSEDQSGNQLGETAQFVLVAATLLLIKSKSLLPVLDLTDEEERHIEDLDMRLKLYKIYKEASGRIRSSFGERMLYARTSRASTSPLFMPDSYTTPVELRQAISSVLCNLPKKASPRTNVSVRKVVSLEEVMRHLQDRITRQFKISFSAFSGGGERGDVIVSFLAVLELIKQGMVMVLQSERFADFDIERESVDTPRYL